MLRIRLLVELANFSGLRRHLGLARAETLIDEISTRCHIELGGARVRPLSDRLVAVEFEAGGVKDAEAASARLQQSFSNPFNFDGELHLLRLRIGGAAGRDCDCEEVRLVEAAEKALAEAREQGRDVVRDDAEDENRIDPLELVHELPRAIEAGEIFLQYQPKVHVRRQQVASAEALVRWRHPTRGLVLPGEFIQAAEQSRAIGNLTLWTLERVLKDQRRLADEGHDLPIFVNMSGVLLADACFVEQACRVLGDEGARVGFEITETAVIRDPESAIRHLQRFADIGVAIAIDDYGAGLSSLAYLKQLPAKELKIDKLFVTQLTSSNRDPLIVRSTIDLAHALDMEVTAEGVETPAAMALLSVMGCDMIQGYLVSRPVEIEAFRLFLEEEAHLKALDSQRFSFLRSDRLWKSA
ncbi:EAL domain-containing protein [Sphingomonas desiccabilis]|uniref:EAL domain-containing protein n=1 Tax=Sphingomonas desiccabilis TaxID=429134 RepID=A0A4Q2IVF8_9SPHN|nr:EAL domain-containing protein [Sphingomonas desiccabilis]MBB3909985.1 EAL domain-containing protein (putative c-di-GMP-specific phosphodiesterase class I) [Sphingomonas desiccabilis]RXZ34689.1 EAL domain-containing protein [Sphingomonas desiccabilis]